ncbi:MAG TPA: DEAD/DEAH box helicase family protein [Ktedonobacteraceae bacterium]|nr:DEAD/DEAH box helicase family protein [Ktedonobacteraceae bacterium]
MLVFSVEDDGRKQHMRSLYDLNLVSVMDTSRHNLTTEFFEPLLSHSVFYDRGVGFFSSGWLRINTRGMVAFANNGGRARWVTSPILEEADWAALQDGHAARTDKILFDALDKNILHLSKALEEDTLSAFAWMVADEILTFKLALPHEKLYQGDFHDKFGIFTDALGNSVSFNGSYNDSIQGTRNYESIKIFGSWHSEAFRNLVQDDQQRFERLWNNLDANVRVFDIPEAAREKILQLRTGERPYKRPQWIKPHQGQQAIPYKSPVPIFPGSIIMRPYQLEAIDAWFQHNCCGLLEMATGTGKTITALAASVRVYEEEKQLALVIAVPYQHLVDQWAEQAKLFGYRPILAYKSKKYWLEELNTHIRDYTSGYRSFLCVITTHTTFISAEFQNCMACLKKTTLLIADEAHHLGAEKSRESYPNHVSHRLALSATPDRWFDDEGTAALRAYFGETVFSFPLEKAIGVSLTPYYYYPHLVALTDEELEHYHELSNRIIRLSHSKNEDQQQALERLLIRRAKLLNNATNKLSALSELVDTQENIGHALFYCTPEQISKVTHLLMKEKCLFVSQFTANENAKEREQLLKEFASGKLQGLVAMKCLDEGVDVPSTQVAYILASSSNPREFIQRRGRVLRMAPSKDVSVIHDFITVPPIYDRVQDSPAFESERRILRRELQRFKEFANLALNKFRAIEVIWDLAKEYDIMDF